MTEKAKAPRRGRGGEARAKRPAGAEQSLRDKAYEAIKHRIITCAFRPGEYVNEVRVANLLGIGRTPVHQALARLRLEGMVDVIPRKGVLVRPLTLNEVMQISEVRQLNEVYCVRLAAERADENDIADLRKVIAESRQWAKSQNIEKIIMLDREFHLLLARAAKNAILSDLLRNLTERSLRTWFSSITPHQQYHRVHEEHDAILEAIVQHSPDAAEATMRRHFESFRASITRHL